LIQFNLKLEAANLIVGSIIVCSATVWVPSTFSRYLMILG